MSRAIAAWLEGGISPLEGDSVPTGPQNGIKALVDRSQAGIDHHHIGSSLLARLVGDLSDRTVGVLRVSNSVWVSAVVDAIASILAGERSSSTNRLM
ncbi:hypothetical protein NDA01_25930 [Trichocoleus desertorum AS-A10]